MRAPLFFYSIVLTVSLCIISCGSNDKKENNGKEPVTTPSTENNRGVPAIDTLALKDEASILDAMQKVVAARLADEKNKELDPNYEGHYLELLTLYTTVIKAATIYSKSLTDPARAVEFGNKLSAIENKLYEK